MILFCLINDVLVDKSLHRYNISLILKSDSQEMVCLQLGPRVWVDHL